MIAARQKHIPWPTRLIFDDCVSTWFLSSSWGVCITGRVFSFAFSHHGYFILSTKWGLNTCALLEISLEVTTSLEVTNFLGGVAYSAKSTCVKSACTEVTSTESTCTRGTESASIETTGIGSIFIIDICSGGACIGSAGAVICSKIYSQSFRNLEVRGAELKIQIRSGCTDISSTWVETSYTRDRNLMSWDSYICS